MYPAGILDQIFNHKMEKWHRALVKIEDFQLPAIEEIKRSSNR
jgi:hypothetical protein